jgi:hypothetical protein
MLRMDYDPSKGRVLLSTVYEMAATIDGMSLSWHKGRTLLIKQRNSG